MFVRFLEIKPGELSVFDDNGDYIEPLVQQWHMMTDAVMALTCISIRIHLLTTLSRAPTYSPIDSLSAGNSGGFAPCLRSGASKKVSVLFTEARNCPSILTCHGKTIIGACRI